MSSRSPSTSPPRRADQPSMERLSLRRGRGRGRRPRRRLGSHSPERGAALPVPPPAHMLRDRPLSPPSPPSLYASVLGSGLTRTLSQHEEESGSASASDSPSCINIITIPEIQESSPPMTPPSSPPAINTNPTDMSRDRHLLSPPLQDVSVLGSGIHAPLQPQYQEEPESGSELDSPPRITFLAIPKDPEPSSPTSPPGSRHSISVNPAGSPKYSLSDEEDPYFDSMVDNFVTAAANTCDSTMSDDDIDYKAIAQRRCVLFAENALKHYNNDEKNQIKYELISAITSYDILVKEGCFVHVNFTAKGNQRDSKDELFFAELFWDQDTPVATCVVSLEGIKSVGGLHHSKYDNFYRDVLPMDAQHCYACGRKLRHPKNGELYKIGHIAMGVYYFE